MNIEDYPVPEYFKIKILLDTQILAYLIDETYPRLNMLFGFFSESPFVDIVCSRFATYEFIGIRKLEHYLRKIHNHTLENGGVMNFGSVLKYKRDWNAPELKFEEVFEDIKKEVEADLKRINDDYSINYEEGILHQGIWKPHKDLVLSSKISKEDSLVLLSSLFPHENSKVLYSVFLTNDDKFYRSFDGNEKMASVDTVMEDNSLEKPETYKIANIKTPISNIPLNLVKGTKSAEQIVEYGVSFILEHLQLKNKNLKLGKVVPCPKKMDGKLLCFKLESQLNKGIYISILDKNLKYVYNLPTKIDEFYNKEKIENFPYVFDRDVEDSENISTMLLDEDGNFLEESLYRKITETGNIVFIHPDSAI